MTKRKTETVNDLSRCLDPLDTDATLIAVIEMSQSSWLVAGIVPGVERQPLKKLAIDERALLNLLSRWRAEAEKKGHRITRIAVAFEAGHDGFWLARWLAAQGVEPHVIHSSSVAVTREHRRAKTDHGSRWWGPALVPGFNAAVKNGSTASELRRRCACVHHGSGHCDPPDTRLRCESPRAPTASSPRTRHPDTTSVPPCSGLSRLSLETMEREVSAERRPALTAPARADF